MLNDAYDIIIIGGGPAGLAAGAAAYEAGCTNVLIVERDNTLGGILNQCIHNGFGLHTFKEELTGPEYAARFVDKVTALKIPYVLNTMVVDLQELDGKKQVTLVSRAHGLRQITAGAVVLAMGCRERSRGALHIPGHRPAGVFSAGTAQRLVNMEGYMPGKEIVILGSGDIGLIMARRLTLEGATVKLVAELMPYSGGLKRNIVQCLDDYNIPLMRSHTVTQIHGKNRVQGVTIAQVDELLKPIAGTETYVACDTLLLSVGLIPENELSSGMGAQMQPITGGPVVNESLETSIPGVFACGNVLHVHDLVDFVTEEAAAAGENAAKYVQGNWKRSTRSIAVLAKNGVRYIVPQSIDPDNAADEITLRFRVGNIYKNHYISLYVGDKRILHKKKQILAPGEMETLTLKKTDLCDKTLAAITVTLEEA